MIKIPLILQESIKLFLNLRGSSASVEGEIEALPPQLAWFFWRFNEGNR